ncbi:MAG: hypothetical protein OEZ68_21905 [Gammaproteobacteria bacterium]|nr:hypothetical protein [Gammaproteobacteria bacterium]MDH5803445.1 hypothetical protein [Gammaproteobacteria bacterium]
MGIFKKNKDDDFEADASTYTQNSSISQAKPMNQSRPTSNQNYGIEDAIALMRKLPNVNSDITITVVKKTLESAHIKVAQIISDAENKESQIQDRTTHLSQEINQLQNRIATLNDEITALTADLKETTKVKDLLKSASKAEGKKPEPAQTQALELEAEELADTAQSV